MTRNANSFDAFKTDDGDDETRQPNNVKKALKKLREIDALNAKDASLLNPEEYEKIQQKPYWTSFLPATATDTPANPHPTKEERKRAKADRKEKERVAQKKKSEEEWERAKADRKEWEREQQERAKEKEQNKPRPSPYAFIDAEFRDEYLKNDKNINKTHRMMSKKYHPDKNPTLSNAVQLQQYLNGVKDRYEEDRYKVKEQ